MAIRTAESLQKQLDQSTKSSFDAAMRGPEAPKNDPMDLAAQYMAKDNRAMQLAETEARQQSNRRGMLNSSMAVGAAQDAVAKIAVPLAQQRSDQLEGRYGRAQEFGFNAALATQQGNIQRGLSAQEFEQNSALSDQDFRQKLGLSKEEYRQNLELQKREFGQQSRMSAQEFQQASKLSDQEFRQQMGMSKQEYAFNLQFQEREQRLDRELANLDADTRQSLMQMEADMRIAIEEMGLNEAQRTDMASMLTSYADNYQQAFAQILGNPDLKAEDRAALMKSAGDFLKVQTNMVSDLYGINVNWSGGSISTEPSAFDYSTVTRKTVNDAPKPDGIRRKRWNSMTRAEKMQWLRGKGLK